MQPTVEITPEVLGQLDEEFNEYSFLQVHDMAYDGGRIIITPEQSTQRQEFQMEPDAMQYLSQFLGLPLNYVTKIEDPQVLAMLWNYHIRHRGSDIDVLKAVARGNMLRSFTTRSFQPLRPSAVVQACREAIADCVFERQPDVWNRTVRFHLTGPDLYEEFANTLGMVSDVHHFSIGVEFDFGGGDSPGMGGYGHRHSCGNIMHAPYGVGGKQFRIFTTQPDVILAKFTEFTRKGVEFVRGTMIPKIRATMEAQVPDMANEISDLAKKYGLPERVEALVFEAARTEDLGGTMYHMVNAITRAANSDRCPPEMIARLHKMAGEITVRHDPAQPIRRCESCHQKIKKPVTVDVTEAETTPTDVDPEPPTTVN